MGISPNARVCTKHKDRTAGTTCRSSASSSPSPDFRDSSGDSSARVERRAPYAKTAKGKFAESSLFIVGEPAATFSTGQSKSEISLSRQHGIRDRAVDLHQGRSF